MQAPAAVAPIATYQPHDKATVLAIAVVAYVLAKIVHEAIGHGLSCEFVGGDLLAFSSSWCLCDKGGVGLGGRRVIEAGGTLANLGVGLAALLILWLRNFRSGSAYAFTWLTAAVHLYMGGGYLMVDPLFRFGDWGDFLTGLEPGLAWRLSFSAIGTAITLGTFFALRGPLEKLLGGTQRERVHQARLLCWLPWLGVGGVLLTGAAAFNAFGPKYALTSALATIGGTFLLVWSPAALDRKHEAASATHEVRRSMPWLAAGAVTLVFLFAVLGPGIEMGR